VAARLADAIARQQQLRLPRLRAMRIGRVLRRVHARGRQPALRARAALAARGLRRIPQRRHGGRLFCGAMIGAALVGVLPPVSVLVGEAGTRSSLLVVFVLSGVLRAIVAALFVRRVRELRKPRRSLSPQSLVMRITGVSAMLGVLYDLIGRPPGEAADVPEPARAPAVEPGEKAPRDA